MFVSMYGFNDRTGFHKIALLPIKPQVEKYQLQSNLNQYLSPNEERALAYLRLGFKLFESKNYSQAIKAFNEVIKIQPNNQYAYFGRGYSYVLLKQYQQGKTDLDKSIQLDNSISFAHFFRGVANRALGNKNDAITDLEAAAKLFDRDGETELAKTSRDAIKQIRNV
ncbi:MAG: tetratricopeptide repeat protein [Rivularia sp. ALOHA_DT_140]|nr:tetratricopeptide repeat protein [Rivularia sp. ALOHA_DT_140]